MGADGCDYEKFKKMSPPLNGDPDPTVADAWIKRLEKIFKVHRCSDQKKVAYTIFMMEGEAEHSCDRKECVLGIEVEQLSGEDLEEVFYNKYISQFVQNQKEEEFLGQVQGSMTVAQHEAKFTHLTLL